MKKLLLVCISAVWLASPASALQSDKPPDAGDSSETAETPETQRAEEPRLVGVVEFLQMPLVVGDESRFTGDPNFVNWLARLAAGDKTPTVYINGIALQGVTITDVDPETREFSFTMKRSLMSDNADVWDSVRKRRSFAGEKPGFNERRVLLSFGDEDKQSLDVKPLNATIVLIADEWVAFWIVLFALVIVALVELARRSDILKEPSSPESPLRIFSLARCQMAAWFMIVSLSFVFVWLITGNLAAFNSDVLLLMGISSVTYLSSVAIGTNPDEDVAKQALAEDSVRRRVEEENVDLRTAVKEEIKATREKVRDYEMQVRKAAAKAPADAEGEKEFRKKLTSARKRLAELRAIPVGFFREILSDSKGIKLHRFQILVWTVIFIIIFTTQVIQGLVLPELGATFLGLMGISSGTYIGFKFPEVKSNE